MPSILVLEDDANMRGLLVECLEDEGHEVSGAESAIKAIEVAREVRLDLVVADVRMAGMDGLDCLGALKKLFPELKSVVITGYADQEAPYRALSIEVDDYLYKPFDLASLQLVVRRVLAGGEERSAYEDAADNLLAACRRIVRKAGQAVDKVHERAAEGARDRFFQHFFVAMRSGMLLPATALKVWDQLDRLEQARQTEGSVEWQKIRDGYRYLADVVVALARSGTVDSSGPREPGALAREAFFTLFAAVKGGALSVEQLKMVPLIASADPEELKASGSLWALHQAIWGGEVP